MAGTNVLISLVLHLAFSFFFTYWSAQHCASLKASVGVCSKFNYSFLQPDQTDLFDTENTVFTKPVHLVQQQCMVRRRGLKGSKRRREINDSRQNTSQVTSLSHKTTRHEEELAAGPCAGPGWHKSEPQRWQPAASDFGQAFRTARADFIPCEVQCWQTTFVHQSCMWLKKNFCFCFFFSQRSHRQSTEDNKAAGLWPSQF